jgi:hypothetical protein
MAGALSEAILMVVAEWDTETDVGLVSAGQQSLQHSHPTKDRTGVRSKQLFEMSDPTTRGKAWPLADAQLNNQVHMSSICDHDPF